MPLSARPELPSNRRQALPMALSKERLSSRNTAMTQCQQLYELQKKVKLIKGKNTPESSRALEAKVSVLEAKSDNSSNESLSLDEKPKANYRNNPAHDRKGSRTRQSHADT